MTTDPANDNALLSMIDRQKFFERLYNLTIDPQFGFLRTVYFISAQRLNAEIEKRIRG